MSINTTGVYIALALVVAFVGSSVAWFLTGDIAAALPIVVVVLSIAFYKVVRRWRCLRKYRKEREE